MNTPSFASSIRAIPGDLRAHFTIGLILMGAVLISGAGLVKVWQLESSPAAGECLGPVLPLLPFVTVFVINIQP